MRSFVNWLVVYAAYFAGRVIGEMADSIPFWGRVLLGTGIVVIGWAILTLPEWRKQ